MLPQACTSPFPAVAGVQGVVGATAGMLSTLCVTAGQGTTQGDILSGDDLGRCQARKARCWGDPGHIKQAVRPYVNLSVCPPY